MEIRNQELSQAQLLLDSRGKEIEDLKRSSDAWYNSKWLWIFVGAGATALALKK